MLTRARARARMGVLVAAALVAVAPASVARADITGPVGCDPHDAYCTVISTSPGGGASGSGTTTTVICHNLSTHAVEPCYDPDLGWVGADGCYYKQLQGGQPSPVPGPPGHWYVQSCLGPGAGRGGFVWIVNRAAPGPQQLARIAESLLKLPRPLMELSPPNSTMQIVGVPTWLWLPKASFTRRSASAAVSGIRVTAYATAVRVVWRLGDGSTVTCAGRGTEWTSRDNPTVPSPTCGHTYTRSSAEQPGHVFAVTATVTWHIAWTVNGAGGGTLADLTTTNTINVPVGQAQTVITG